MQPTIVEHIAIIGAGPGGLALALALHSMGISVTVFEQRTRDTSMGGAIILAPNALRVLESLGVYSRLKSKGFNFDDFAFVNEQHELLNKFPFGSKSQYGFSALRIRRRVVVSELVAVAEERGITIQFERNFSHVVEENETGVTFQFKDGLAVNASLLVGADGIHSRVRMHLDPLVKPIYSGQLALGCVVPKSAISFPVPFSYQFPAIIYGTNGAFLFIPEDVAGEEILIGTQKSFPERDREGWTSLSSSKEEVMELFKSNLGAWPEMVASGVTAATKEHLTIWPYYSIPRSEKWLSEGERVVILGDAAHAIPPTGGQGACMAFEDAYSLALVLSCLSSKLTLQAGLKEWQKHRLERVDNVMALTRQLGSLRLSADERAELARKEEMPGDYLIGDAGSHLSWLYSLDLGTELQSWFQE
ncbi:FAD dependent oxidoreductase [Cadophora sp. DSE1049]|nr:FAD dependent oxidoreductase [Cadophora sp. DSE1049]